MFLHYWVLAILHCVNPWNPIDTQDNVDPKAIDVVDPEVIDPDNRRSDDDDTRPCRFKGVVLQPNGHYGAQIYANHQRIWLGTFKTENEAAIAYDRATIKIRSDDSYRNIKSSPEIAALEVSFQSHFSMDDVLFMIKDGSYQSKLAEFSRTCRHQPDPRHMIEGYGEKHIYTKLFEKELTPSDVGKLNRLVIPKKCALKFLPKSSEVGQSLRVNASEIDHEMEYSFFDKEMKCWKFRFCYWNSSQSYVFTRGWKNFVNGKGLKPHDVVVFYTYRVKGEGEGTETRKYWRIDVQRRQETSNTTEVEGPRNDPINENNQIETKGKKKCFRLFGVDIIVED